MQRLLFAQPFHARWLLPLIIGIYKQRGVDEEIKRLLNWGCETCFRRNDVGSLLWFLYASISLGISLDKSTIDRCVSLGNELVDLTLLHGRANGIFRFDISQIRTRYQLVSFNSSGWIVLYEVERRSWDNSASFQKFGTRHDKDRLYEKLASEAVEFYNVSPEILEVSALAGWNLDQSDFDERLGVVDDGAYDFARYADGRDDELYE